MIVRTIQKAITWLKEVIVNYCHAHSKIIHFRQWKDFQCHFFTWQNSGDKSWQCYNVSLWNSIFCTIGCIPNDKRMQKYGTVLKSTCKIGVTVSYFEGKGMKLWIKKYIYTFVQVKWEEQQWFPWWYIKMILKIEVCGRDGIIYSTYHISVGVFAEYRFCVLSVHGLA